jgi:hypothetical protein
MHLWEGVMRKSRVAMIISVFLWLNGLIAMNDPTQVSASLQSNDFPAATISMPLVQGGNVSESWQQYLFAAVDAGAIDMVQKFLEFHKNFAQQYGFPPLLYISDLYGRTLLICAVMIGKLEMVKLILNNINIEMWEAYINLRDGSGWTAIVYADHFKHRDIQNELNARATLSHAQKALHRARESLPVVDTRTGVKLLRTAMRFFTDNNQRYGTPVIQECSPEEEKDSDEEKDDK